MNLNHIQLPASVIAGLYKNSLIETDQNSPAETLAFSIKKTDKSDNKWKYLGENKKNILIVVNYDNTVYLPDAELSFLTNMLLACKLSLGEVAIVNRNNYEEVNYKELVAQFSSKIIFLFGIDPVLFGLPVSFPHFQLQPFSNATFLFSPSIEEIENDKLLKSKLWVSLKRLFNL
jgi:hypothetical protein